MTTPTSDTRATPSTKVRLRTLNVYGLKYLQIGPLLFTGNTPEWTCKRLYGLFCRSEGVVTVSFAANGLDALTGVSALPTIRKGRLSVSPAGQLLLGGQVLRTEEVYLINPSPAVLAGIHT